MISVDEALRKVLDNLPLPAIEKVDSRAARGRILAQDLTATGDIPPFNKSAVDGYALRAADAASVPVELRCAGESRAGAGKCSPLEAGEAVAIMTGAPVPDGADAVQMIENTQSAADGTRVTILKKVSAGENIILAGSEASAGKSVLDAGRYIGPAEAAILAIFGCREAAVFRRPRVALTATGDELVEPNETPGAGQIRNSNATLVAAQLELLGLEPEYMGITRDDRAQVNRVVREGLHRDVLILTGGVSVGAYDFVEEVLQELGLEVIFSGVAIRPGKPTVFARKDDRLVFGLPGNPISTFVAFELFVRPALERMCGLASAGLFKVRGRLSAGTKHKPGRTSFMPARLSRLADGWAVEPLPWKGSSDIIGFSRANSLLVLPQGKRDFAQGESAEVMLLPDYLRRLTREVQ